MSELQKGQEVWIKNPFKEDTLGEDLDSNYRIEYLPPLLFGRPPWLPAVIDSIASTGEKIKCVTKYLSDAFNKAYDIKKGDVLPRSPHEIPLSISIDTNLFKELTKDGVNFIEIHDMVELTHLNDSSILYHIMKRFQVNRIYTRAGVVLIAMNPYKIIENWEGRDFEIYDSRVMSLYRNKEANKSINLPPHIFEETQNAYKSLINNCGNQSLIISGESGSGKTETAKRIMRFLANISLDVQQQQNKIIEGDFRLDEGKQFSIENIILESNPVLEAFGNAKTNRNDNSSRFGKFIKIKFNSEGFIIGGEIQKYLLEKCRISNQLKGERNYHVFYHLLLGTDDYERELYKLDEIEKFKCFTDTKNFVLKSMNDNLLWKELKQSMKSIGINEIKQREIFSILSAVLHMSNIEFIGEESPVCSSLKELEIISDLLGLNSEEILKKICFKEIIVGKKVTLIPAKLHEAIASTSALAKELYSRVFDWLVMKINLCLLNSNSSQEFSKDSIPFIGILDIFGFEVFTSNSFEQLCINYANEKLQNNFTEYCFKQEIELYEKEGIDYSSITFTDNSDIIALIENKIGLLALLDEACLFPKGSDSSFLSKLKTTFAKSTIMGKFTHDSFTINHSASPCTYLVANFVEKNKDKLKDNVLTLMGLSSNDTVKELFSCHNLNEDTSLEMTSTNNEFPNRHSRQTSAGTNSASLGSTSGSGNNAFLGYKFKQDVNTLSNLLKATNPFFIRCIKPNTSKQPSYLKPSVVLNQLVYLGVLDSIKVKFSGYGYRLLHVDFYKRFSILAPKVVSKYGKDLDGTPGTLVKDACNMLMLQLFKIVNSQKTLTETDEIMGQLVQLGNSLVFMKRTFNSQIEVSRKRLIDLMNNSAVVIQSLYKGYQTNRRYFLLKKNIVILQACWRGYLIRQNWLRRGRSIVCIQTRLRGWIKRCYFVKLKRLYKVVCTLWFKRKGKRELQVLQSGLYLLQILSKGYYHRMETCNKVNSVRLIQRKYRSHLIIKYWKLKRNNAAILIQKVFRSYLTRKRNEDSFLYIKTLRIRRKMWVSFAKFVAKWKMKITRKKYLLFKGAATLISRWWKARCQRYLFLKISESIKVLQSFIKISLARRKVCSLRAIKEIEDENWRSRLFRERELLYMNTLLGNIEFPIVDVDVITDLNDIYKYGWTKCVDILLKLLHLKGDQIVGINAGTTFTVVLSKLGHVYTFGFNDESQLGRLNSSNFGINLKSCRVLNSISNIKIKEVSCGRSHTLLMAEDGTVLSFGGNSRGQCGQGKFKTRSLHINKIKLKRRAVHIYCGGLASYVIIEGGLVYSCGAKEYCGIYSNEDSNEDDLYIPTGMNKLLKLAGSIRDIVCGSFSCLALSISGKVFGWGENHFNQLGFENEVLLRSPREVLGYTGKIVGITTGGKHSLLLNHKGSIFVSGSNKFGQLGLGIDKENQANLCHLIVNYNGENISFSSAVACYRSTMLISTCGKVFGMGKIHCIRDQKGFLHNPSYDNTNNKVYIPTFIGDIPHETSQLRAFSNIVLSAFYFINPPIKHIYKKKLFNLNGSSFLEMEAQSLLYDVEGDSDGEYVKLSAEHIGNVDFDDNIPKFSKNEINSMNKEDLTNIITRNFESLNEKLTIDRGKENNVQSDNKKVEYALKIQRNEKFEERNKVIGNSKSIEYLKKKMQRLGTKDASMRNNKHNENSVFSKNYNESKAISLKNTKNLPKFLNDQAFKEEIDTISKKKHQDSIWFQENNLLQEINIMENFKEEYYKPSLIKKETNVPNDSIKADFPLVKTPIRKSIKDIESSIRISKKSKETEVRNLSSKMRILNSFKKKNQDKNVSKNSVSSFTALHTSHRVSKSLGINLRSLSIADILLQVKMNVKGELIG